MGAKIGKVTPEEWEKNVSLDYVNCAGVLPHKEFTEMMSDSDVFVTTVPGVWSIRTAEAMAAGCIPFTTPFTAESMHLDPTEYPFICSEGQMQNSITAFAKYLKKDGVAKWRKYVRDHAVKHFDIKKQSDKVYQYCKSYVDDIRSDMKVGDFESKVANVIDGSTQVSHEYLKENLDGYVKDRTDGLFTHRYLRNVVFNMGYKDAGNDEDGHPIYEKI
jgi:hypothetical protein